MTSAGARPTFRTVSFLQSGYAVGEVDAFLDEVFAAIATDAPVPNIAAQRFGIERRGYDMAEVDDFLDEIDAELPRRDSD